MGTSGAYGGSAGGAWSVARRRARRIQGEGTDGDINRILNGAAPGFGFDTEAADGPNEGQQGQQEPAAPAPLGAMPAVSWGPISAHRAGGGGTGGGTGGGRGGGPRGAGGGTGRGRSARRAARVGGRAARAAFAIASGNAGILASEFGLRLEDLIGLSPAEQAQRITDRLIVGDSVENAELLKAADKLILAQLAAGGAMTPVEVTRLYATSYIDEIMATELGGVLNDGNHTAQEVREIERKIHEAVEATIDGIVVDDATTIDTEETIRTVLVQAQSLLARLRRAR
jgi:hypothetical protein